MKTRYPRTLQEAFGPYTSSDIAERPGSGHPSTFFVAVIAVATCLLIVFGVIP